MGRLNITLGCNNRDEGKKRHGSVNKDRQRLIGDLSKVPDQRVGRNSAQDTNHDQNTRVKIPGGLSDNGAVADGTVWGVNSGGDIYRYTGDQPG
ncbi:hypothetical protein AB0F36_32835 [Streptomyces sp. NPDC029080]|uniref:hypothetical protein n=1 Tax=Streptomyces sp. NPDC029080 TaxID=3155017 RepID=UPI0033CA8CFB